jgi:hypothetical protein
MTTSINILTPCMNAILKEFYVIVQSSSSPHTTFAVKPVSTGTPDDLNLMLLVMALKAGNAISSTCKK